MKSIHYFKIRELYGANYFRNQTDMSRRCRGTISLANAFTHTEDSCSFVIASRGSKTFHLKASSEVERQKWVTALELAKAKAISLQESGKTHCWLLIVFNSISS